MIWKAGVEFVTECDWCETAFLYLTSGRPQASHRVEGMGKFDVYSVRHGSRFLSLGCSDSWTDSYGQEHTSHQLSQGYVVSMGSVTAVRYPRKDHKGPLYVAMFTADSSNVIKIVYI